MTRTCKHHETSLIHNRFEMAFSGTGTGKVCIISWNVMAPCLSSETTADAIQRIEGIKRVITNHDPDIVCIQEATPILLNSFESDLDLPKRFETVAKSLYCHYEPHDQTYWPDDCKTTTEYGNLTLLHKRVSPFHQNLSFWTPLGNAINIVSCCDAYKNDYVIANVHLDCSSPDLRKEEWFATLATLKHRIQDPRTTVIMAGDFNQTTKETDDAFASYYPTQSMFQLFRDDDKDTTTTTHETDGCIDDIRVHRGTCVRASVLTEENRDFLLSDHHPLMAFIEPSC